MLLYGLESLIKCNKTYLKKKVVHNINLFLVKQPCLGKFVVDTKYCFSLYKRSLSGQTSTQMHSINNHLSSKTKK